jgi:hypothetical protein
MQTPTRFALIVDRLYRVRWWTSAILCAVLGFALGGGREGGPLAWTLFILFALLLWLPILIRGLASIRASRKSFNDGLHDR